MSTRIELKYYENSNGVVVKKETTYITAEGSEKVLAAYTDAPLNEDAIEITEASYNKALEKEVTKHDLRKQESKHELKKEAVELLVKKLKINTELAKAIVYG